MQKVKYVCLTFFIGIFFLTLLVTRLTTWKGIPIIVLILSVGVFLFWVTKLFSWARKIRSNPFPKISSYATGFMSSYLLVILLFSVIYYAASKLGYEIKPVENFIDYFYFSVVTATTLGYGDIVPSGWLIKLISIIEVTFGVVFLTAILTVILAFRHPED